MGRGGAIYLSYTALVLLAGASSANAEIKGLWKISIDESPAPSPKDGPPISAHAIRDRSVLPYEIVGIIGAYLVSVLLLGTLLLTMGRKLRKRAQEMVLKPQEMVKPMIKTFDPSPTSPSNGGSWYARKFSQKKSAVASVKSAPSEYGTPMTRGSATFDQSVIQRDKAQAIDSLADIYAKVYEDQDDEVGGIAVTTEEVQPAYSEYTSRSPIEPKSPKVTNYSTNSQYVPPPLPPPPEDYVAPPHHARAASGGSGHTTASTASQKKQRHLLKNINTHRTTYKGYGNNSDGALDPLSPTHEPPTARTLDSQYAPTTPGTGVSWQSPYEQYVQDPESYRGANMGSVPHPAPQRGNSYQNEEQAPAGAFRPNPAQTTSVGSIPARLNSASATNLNNALPLREYNRAAVTQPIREQPAFPLSPGYWNNGFLSPTPVKTTFVTSQRNPYTGGPLTGVPYSPYMPQTPLTPITPRLPSRAERKQREREERTIRGAITEEDAVVDDKDMWDSGY